MNAALLAHEDEILTKEEQLIREQRRDNWVQARAIVELEGFFYPKEMLEYEEAYVNGEITIDEIKEKIFDMGKNL